MIPMAMNGTPAESHEVPVPLPQTPSDGIPIQPSSFLQRTDWLSFWITTTLALAVYLFTLAPEVTLEHSGELSTAAKYAGVAHPPGYAFWTLYAWLFTKLLPFSNIAWRVAVSSAVAGALACGLIALNVSRAGLMLLESIRDFKRLAAREENWLRILCGCVAGLGFAFDRSFWSEAVIVETKALGLLLFSLILILLLRWVYAPEQRRYLYASFFIYGLSLNTSLVLAIAAPGLPFIILFRSPALGRDLCFALSVIVAAAVLGHIKGFLPQLAEAATQMDSLWHWHLAIGIVAGLTALALAIFTRVLLSHWKIVSVSLLLFLLGLSACFWLALTSMSNPPDNWGYPRTVEGFTHVISRGQYEHLSPTGSFHEFLPQVIWYTKNASNGLGILYLVAAAIPFYFIRSMESRERGWLLGLAATYVCLALLLTAMLNPPPDRAAADLIGPFCSAAHLVLAVWAGYGLVLLGTILVRQPTVKAATSTTW